MRMSLKPVEKMSEFEELPEGRYAVKVNKYEFMESKNTGNKYLKWTLKVTGEDKFNNSLIWMNTFPHIENPWFFAQFVKSIDPNINTSDFELDDLIGKTLEVDIKYDSDKEGKKSEYPTVKRFYPYISEIPNFADYDIK